MVLAQSVQLTHGKGAWMNGHRASRSHSLDHRASTLPRLGRTKMRSRRQVVGMSQVQVIPVSNEDIRELRIAPVRQFLQPYLDDPAKMSQLIKQQISFDIQFMMQEDDPREFCDVPEVRVQCSPLSSPSLLTVCSCANLQIRLWFLRLDAAFPWLPAMLELRSGTLALYSAMLVPHVMDRQVHKRTLSGMLRGGGSERN
eukprot:scaffold7390_cov420-Prasinococcus_capsulatus_cf.AAC.3